LKHFKRFFEDYQFSRIITNTITISFYNIIAGFPVTIITALSINAVRQPRYKRSVQMITYMPYFISTVVLVGILMQMLSPKIGVLSLMYQSLTGSARDVLGIPSAFPHLYVWSGLWQHVGWGTIIYIAALAGVDPAQHEAAIIDGANRVQRMIYIEIPAIMPTAMILLILNTGAIMNVGFEKVFLMQNTLNLSTSEVISTYVYKRGIGGTGKSDFSYAAAIGLFNSVINFALVVSVNNFSKLIKQETLW
jgi:putative aldouronate transport system permease protein